MPIFPDETRVTTLLSSLEQKLLGGASVVKWSGTSWPARPAGAAWGVVWLSTNDPNATAPPAAGLLVGDVWRKHPDAA